MIYVITHPKGGVGKSTLTVNLAVELKAEILDADFLNSCDGWNKIRAAAGTEPITCYTPESAADAKKIMTNYAGRPDRRLLVDCGGFDSETNRIAMLYADAIFTPLAPSTVELFGLQKFVQILRNAATTAGRELIANIIINNADPRSPGTIRELQEFIRNSNGPLNLLDTVVHMRADFKKSFGAGMSVTEFNPKDAAAAEIVALANEIRSVEG